MPGWPDALNDIVRDTPVTHLAVYKLDHTGFARSADFTQVSKPELLFILKHMESPSTNTNLYLSVLVNNKEYMIDHTEVTKKALRASGPVQDGKDKEMETVWVERSEDYVVFGIADFSDDADCKREVGDLLKYIEFMDSEHAYASLGEHVKNPDDLEEDNDIGEDVKDLKDY